MKANEAPKRIWINSPQDLPCGTVDSNSVEYTRTDAFIEKACKWFRDIDYDNSIPPFETTEEFIEGFKKAMKL